MVVVGAGRVASRKIAALLEYGADITVIAPEVAPAVSERAEQGEIELHQRPYRKGDLNGAFLVVAATGDRAVDEAVYAEATGNNSLVNVVDVPELCTCIVPAIARRGQFQVAVSTNGAAPGVARDFRNSLEADLPDWWEAYIDVLSEARMLVKASKELDAEMRSRACEALSGSEVRERFASGENPSAAIVYEQAMASLSHVEGDCAEGPCENGRAPLGGSGPCEDARVPLNRPDRPDRPDRAAFERGVRV